jgi:hypothetical protein
MPELETVTLKAVEVFDIGTWNGSGYTDEDLDKMVAAFAELRGIVDPPAKLGHTDDQSILTRSGFPAAGWIESLYRQGTKLVADIGRVPKALGDLIKSGAYRKRSSEILLDASFNGKRYPYVFSGLAFLGEEIPAVSTLDDIKSWYSAVHFHKGGKAALITYAHNTAPTAPEEGPMTRKDEEAALVGTLERLRNGSGLAAFARETLTRLRAFTRRDHQDDDSHEQIRDELQTLIDDQYGGLDGYAWIDATYDDRVIVQKGDTYYSVPYTRAADGTITLGTPTEVEQTWTPATTTPTPIASAATTDVSQPDTQQLKKEKEQMKTIAHALGLKDEATEAEIVAAIAARPTTDQFAKLQTEVAELKEHNLQADATTAVEAAIRAKKVAPASRDQMLPFAKQDPKAFAAFVEKAPAIFAGTIGSEGDAPPAKSAADEINEKVAAAVKADTTGKLSFASALTQVSRAHPELARKYVEEQRASARLS